MHGLLKEAKRVLSGGEAIEVSPQELTIYSEDEFELAKAVLPNKPGRSMVEPVTLAVVGYGEEHEIAEIHMFREYVSGPRSAESRGVTVRVFRKEQIDNDSVEQSPDGIYDIETSGEPEVFMMTHKEAREVYGRKYKSVT